MQALKRRNRKIINGKEYKLIRILEHAVFSLQSSLVMLYCVAPDNVKYTKATMQFVLSTLHSEEYIPRLVQLAKPATTKPAVVIGSKTAVATKTTGSSTFGVSSRKILNQTMEAIRQKHRASTSVFDKVAPKAIAEKKPAVPPIKPPQPSNHNTNGTNSVASTVSRPSMSNVAKPLTVHEKNLQKQTEAKIKQLESQIKQLSIDNSILKQKVLHAEKLAKHAEKKSLTPSKDPENEALKSQLELLQEENEKLHHNIHNETEKVKHDTEHYYQTKLSTISEEFSELKLQLETIISNGTIQIKQLEIEKSNLLQEKSIIEVQVTECKKDIDELQKLLIQEKNSKEKHMAMIKQLQDTIETCNSEITFIKQENTSLQHSLKIVEEKRHNGEAANDKQYEESKVTSAQKIVEDTIEDGTYVEDSAFVNAAQ